MRVSNESTSVSKQVVHSAEEDKKESLKQNHISGVCVHVNQLQRADEPVQEPQCNSKQ